MVFLLAINQIYFSNRGAVLYYRADQSEERNQDSIITIYMFMSK
jgi:hypothetical protein